MIPTHPRFASLIRFVETYDQFKAEVAKVNGCREARAPYTINDRVISDKGALTYDVFDCMAGGISNGELCSLFHLLPVKLPYNPDYAPQHIDHGVVKKGLRQDLDELVSSALHPVRVLLTGGRSYERERSPRCAGSEALFETLCQFFEQITPGRVSKIWGRRNSQVDAGCHVLYEVKSDA